MGEEGISFGQLHNRLLKVEDQLAQVLLYLKNVDGYELKSSLVLPVVNLKSKGTRKRRRAIGKETLKNQLSKDGHPLIDTASVEELEVKRMFIKSPQASDTHDESTNAAQAVKFEVDEEQEVELPMDNLIECEELSFSEISTNELITQEDERGSSHCDDNTSEKDLKDVSASTDNKEGVKCNLCGKTLSRLDALRRHMDVVHLKIKKHVCPYCGNKFSESGNLSQHVRSVHLNLNSRRYSCSFCNKKFYHKLQLEKHTSQHLSTAKNHETPTNGELGEPNFFNVQSTYSPERGKGQSQPSRQVTARKRTAPRKLQVELP